MERGWKRRLRFSYAPSIDLWLPRGEGGPEHYQKKGFHLSGHVVRVGTLRWRAHRLFWRCAASLTLLDKCVWVLTLNLRL